MEAADNDVMTTQAQKQNVNAVYRHQEKRKQGTKMVAGLNQRKNNEQERPCYCCGKKVYTPHNCKFKEAKCFSCGKMGHVSTACRGECKQRQVVNQRQVLEDNDEIEHFQNGLSDSTSRLMLQVSLNRRKIAMEVDTGAAVSVVPIRKLKA